MNKIISFIVATIIIVGLACSLVVCVATPLSMMSPETNHFELGEILMAYGFMIYALLTIDTKYSSIMCSFWLKKCFESMSLPAICIATALISWLFLGIVGFIMHI